MTMPLAILAFFAIALGAIGTPAWPWFRAFLGNQTVAFDWADLPRRGWAVDAHFVDRRVPWTWAWLVGLR